MTQGELFAGIGGFGLAGRWCGIESVFQVEIDPFCQKVLKKNFPLAAMAKLGLLNGKEEPLNPQFSEVMMGYPPDWTKLETE